MPLKSHTNSDVWAKWNTQRFPCVLQPLHQCMHDFGGQHLKGGLYNAIRQTCPAGRAAQRGRRPRQPGRTQPLSRRPPSWRPCGRRPGRSRRVYAPLTYSNSTQIFENPFVGLRLIISPGGVPAGPLRESLHHTDADAVIFIG